jgi:threonine dehydrogenase-like Zn-dependent dehydrogenase
MSANGINGKKDGGRKKKVLVVGAGAAGMLFLIFTFLRLVN